MPLAFDLMTMRWRIPSDDIPAPTAIGKPAQEEGG
jgi:hypothetical protein